MGNPAIIGQVVRLQLLAPEAEWSGVFDRLQVWRSLSGPSGPFEELTAVTWSAPRLPSDAPDPPVPPVTGRSDALVGRTLVLVFEERVTLTVTFTGTDPLTRTQAAQQVSPQLAGAASAYVAPDGSFVVQGGALGAQAILRVAPSDGAGVLGLPSSTDGSEAGSVAYGHDARIQLVPGQDTYEFLDPHSNGQAFYRTRYLSDATGNVSEFSVPFPDQGLPVIDTDDLVTGYLDLVDVSGRPTANREVRVEAIFTGVLLDGRAVAPAQEAKLTDRNGHVEFELIRGTRITVGVAGTLLARTITVPQDPCVTEFSLFDPGVGQDDLFVVQKPNIDFAFRSTL